MGEVVQFKPRPMNTTQRTRMALKQLAVELEKPKAVAPREDREEYAKPIRDTLRQLIKANADIGVSYLIHKDVVRGIVHTMVHAMAPNRQFISWEEFEQILDEEYGALLA